MEQTTEPADWPTTRRFPRTLDEAFGHADRHVYACSIERPPLSERLWRIGVGTCTVLAVVIYVASAALMWIKS